MLLMLVLFCVTHLDYLFASPHKETLKKNIEYLYALFTVYSDLCIVLQERAFFKCIWRNVIDNVGNFSGESFSSTSRSGFA
jgi:hypothetical protein